MGPSRQDLWLENLKSVQRCIFNFRTKRPKNIDECYDKISSLQFYHRVLKRLWVQKVPLKWRDHILFLEEIYPLTIQTAYKELKIVEKLAVVDMEELTTGESESCMICLEELEGITGDVRKMLVCNHLYHADCIFRWCFEHQTCPICRASF